MKISNELLNRESSEMGFRQEMLEKVWYLMRILDGINANPYLKTRLVLKGGTALNLFFFKLPRLSIDIDLNYIGQLDRQLMKEEQPLLLKALQAVCEKEGCELRRSPMFHAGGKFQLRYQSAMGNQGNLQVDINYMYRTPLEGAIKRKSVTVGGVQTNEVAMLSLEEVAAGKLVALFQRKASRDFFDTHHLLNHTEIDLKKLKLYFLAYGTMSPLDMSKISLKDMIIDIDELKRKLVPVLKKNQFETRDEMHSWAERTSLECRNSLEAILAFSAEEAQFLREFYIKGTLAFELITEDQAFVENFKTHPLLAWRRQQIGY